MASLDDRCHIRLTPLMRLMAAPLGLLLALILGLLAVTQVISMEATLRPLTSGGLRTLIDSFDFLTLLIVAVIGFALIVGTVTAINR